MTQMIKIVFFILGNFQVCITSDNRTVSYSFGSGYESYTCMITLEIKHSSLSPRLQSGDNGICLLVMKQPMSQWCRLLMGVAKKLELKCPLKVYQWHYNTITCHIW